VASATRVGPMLTGPDLLACRQHPERPPPPPDRA